MLRALDRDAAQRKSGQPQNAIHFNACALAGGRDVKNQMVSRPRIASQSSVALLGCPEHDGPEQKVRPSEKTFKMAARGKKKRASHIWDRRTRLNNGAAPSSRGNEIGGRGRKAGGAPAPRPEGAPPGTPAVTHRTPAVRFHDGGMSLAMDTVYYTAVVAVTRQVT